MGLIALSVFFNPQSWINYLGLSKHIFSKLWWRFWSFSFQHVLFSMKVQVIICCELYCSLLILILDILLVTLIKVNKQNGEFCKEEWFSRFVRKPVTCCMSLFYFHCIYISYRIELSFKLK